MSAGPRLRARAGVAAALVLAACSTYREGPPPPAGEPCPGGAVDGGDAAATYPPCPYGTSVGSTVADATFVGFDGVGDTSPAPVSFAQFYDPTGTRAQRWLFVDASALWCQPCREEAAELPALHAKLGDRVAFLTVIYQGSQTGVAATPTDAASWMKSFKLPFFTVADPEGAILAYFAATSPPYSMVVDTRTMKIVAAVVGKPASTEQFLTDAIGGS